MSKCYKFIESDLVLNEELLINYIREKLKTPEFENSHLKTVLLKTGDPVLDKMDEIELEGLKHLKQNEESGRKGTNKSDIGTNDYIEAEHVIDKKNIPSRLALKMNENDSLVNKMMEEHPEMGRAEIEQSIKEQAEADEINSKAGNYVHELVHVLIKYHEGSPEFNSLRQKIKDELLANDAKILKELTDLDINLSYKTPDMAITKLINIAKLEILIIDDMCKPENRKALYTEFPMYIDKSYGVNTRIKLQNGTEVEYNGIIGIADFIIIDKNDNIIIGDFKASTKKYRDWSVAKKNKTDYQIGIYRSILAAHGLNGKKISLYTLPIYMERKKLSTMSIPSRNNAGDDAPYVYLMGATSGSGNSRLDWETGSFTRNLREYGFGGDIEVEETIDHTKLEQTILENFGEILGTHKSFDSLNKEKFILDHIHTKYDPEGKTIIGYYFWNDLDHIEVLANTKEELEKEGGLIDQYFNKIKEKNKTLGATIVSLIKEFNKKGVKTENQVFLHNSKNPGLQQLMRSTFSKYINSGWEVEDRIPELLEHNIILFKKKLETGGTIVEAVILSDKLLDTRISINGTEHIIGKYVTDNEAKHISDFIPLNSEYKNVKGLELISILNTLSTKHSELFRNVIFGKMEVISLVGKLKFSYIDTKDLLDNFHFLCTLANLEDNFKNNQLNVATPYELHMTELQEILHDADIDDKLKTCLSKIDYNESTLFKKAENIKSVILKMRLEYPKFALYKDFNSHREYDLNKPEDLVYMTLCMMYNYVRGIKVNYDGRLTKYGINIGEIFKILGMPFYANETEVLKNGNVSTGWLQGMQSTSPQTNPSTIIRQLTAYYDLLYQSVRSIYLKLMSKIQLITKPFIKNHTSGLGQIISSSNLHLWESFLEKDTTGKVKKELLIKNPWDPKSNLSEEERQFLKEILWEIQKYILDVDPEQKKLSYKDNSKIIDNLTSVKEAKRSGTYFQLPLKRADQFQNIVYFRKTGLKKFGESQLEQLRDNFDYRQLHSTRALQIKNSDLITMYNAYDMKASERRELIEHVDNPYDFVFDLDLLASDVAFLNIRKLYFDDALLLTETVVAVMHYQLNGNTNIDYQPVLDTILELKKVNITGESSIDEEFLDASKVAGAMKLINSLILLAGRPLLFFKELTFGMFTNYSRAWALKYTSNKLSYKSIFNANKVIWGLSGKKFCKTLAGSSLVDFTLCEMLNKTYGIANEDLHRFVDNSTNQGQGIVNNYSRWMYIASSAPDYYNRLTLFIAKMMEDGCFEAHSLNEYGELEYDWKKDKRFSELAKHGLNSDYTSSEYLKLKALYRTMCELFEKGGEHLITWNSEQKKYIYGDITKAYTTEERNSIKEVADTAYGFYDHESKSLINHKFFGLLFLQFLTFLSAKINLWFKAKPISLGSNTSQGHWEVVKEDGEIVYREPEIDANGNLTGKVNHYKESQIPEHLKGKLEPEIKWEGDYIEGLIYSIGGMLHDIFHMNWKGLFDDKYRLANVKLALHDLLLGILLFTILKFIFSEGSDKLSDVEPKKRILLRSMQDVGPQAIWGLEFEPSFIKTWTNIKNDGVKLLFHDNPDLINTVTKRFGAAKDFIWEEN